MGSRILPEMAQTIKILKVLPHFRDAKLVFRWIPLGNGKGEFERSNIAFHKACDDKGPLLVLVKLNNNGAIFGVSIFDLNFLRVSQEYLGARSVDGGKLRKVTYSLFLTAEAANLSSAALRMSLLNRNLELYISVRNTVSYSAPMIW